MGRGEAFSDKRVENYHVGRKMLRPYERHIMGNRVFVGILTLTLSVPESNSLKDKRHVVKSVIDNLRNKFNLSVAEIGELDTWRRATIGMACVSNDKTVINSILDKAIRYVESNPQLEVVETEMELV